MAGVEVAEVGTVGARLLEVQSLLKVEKGRYNAFGKFYHRSKEDILQAAKPICHERGLILLMQDTIAEIGGRFYVKSTAKVVDAESGVSISADGWAREVESKTKADPSQITGAASSYAGKRALGNLFAIDDTVDADEQGGASAASVRCRSCGKSYPVTDIDSAARWIESGAEQCCASPAWQLV